MKYLCVFWGFPIGRHLLMDKINVSFNNLLGELFW